MLFVVSMGALDEGPLDLELENGVKLGSIDLGFEEEPETIAIEDAVRVLLHGLGEDINREGLKKTHFRVAKALREGTKGAFFNLHFVKSNCLCSLFSPLIISYSCCKDSFNLLSSITVLAKSLVPQLSFSGVFNRDILSSNSPSHVVTIELSKNKLIN